MYSIPKCVILESSRLTRIGRLIARFSIGVRFGIVHIEVRARDNFELSIEMFAAHSGVVCDPIVVVGSTPPAYCALDSTSTKAKVDWVKSIELVRAWIEPTCIPILAIETGERTQESVLAEQSFLEFLSTSDPNAYDMALHISDRLTQDEEFIIYNHDQNNWFTDDTRLVAYLADLKCSTVRNKKGVIVVSDDRPSEKLAWIVGTVQSLEYAVRDSKKGYIDYPKDRYVTLELTFGAFEVLLWEKELSAVNRSEFIRVSHTPTREGAADLAPVMTSWNNQVDRGYDVTLSMDAFARMKVSREEFDAALERNLLMVVERSQDRIPLFHIKRLS